MLTTAKSAATMAGKLLKSHFGHLTNYTAKGGDPKNFVTKADLASEKLIKKIILNKFPSHNFWGEESGQTRKTSPWTWVVDPLDGTSNFVFNIPLYSVSIALMRDQKVILGVVYIPQTDELFWAQTGRGAYCNGKKIKVSATGQLDQAIASLGYWSKDVRHLRSGLAQFNYFAKRIKKIRYLSSTVFEMCRVAKGNLDFCMMDTFFLDLAAAKLIVEEAGGRCVRNNGDPIKYLPGNELRRIIVSNRALAQELRKRGT